MDLIEMLDEVEDKDTAAAAAAGTILAIAEVTTNAMAKRAAVALVDMISRVWGAELDGPGAQALERLREG